MDFFDTPVVTVFLYASLTAVATGFGALPFLFVPKMSRRWLGISNAIAVGLMLGASFTLIDEGMHLHVVLTVVGMLLGLVFIVLSEKFIDKHNGEVHVAELKGASAKKAIMIVAVMTLHSFTEGVGVGVAFGGDDASLGLFITLAIAIHNIPEGLAISLVLVPRGTRWWVAGLWAIFSSLPQPLMAVPAFLFVEVFEPFLPVGLGFAGGAMIWMVFAELVQEANEDSSPNCVAVTVVLSVAALFAFQSLL